MANKNSFTPEEWTKILESVTLSGVAVTAADPNGLMGVLKESFASASAMMSAKADPGASELVKSVVTEFEVVRWQSQDPRSAQKAACGR